MTTLSEHAEKMTDLAKARAEVWARAYAAAIPLHISRAKVIADKAVQDFNTSFAQAPGR